MSEDADIDWPTLPIVCPHCGNRGETEGAWESNSATPFRLIEDVIRTFPLTGAEIRADGVLSLTADAQNDSVDWESGSNPRFECAQCFREFPVPDTAVVDYD
jgi:hypothetical protein